MSDAGSSGSGTITWSNTTPGICTLTGTMVTADANGSCILTVSIAADATYSAASDSITITVSSPGGGGSGGGGSSGGGHVRWNIQRRLIVLQHDRCVLRIWWTG